MVDERWAFHGSCRCEFKESTFDQYVQAGALAEKHPIDAFDGSFEYIMTDIDISEFTFALRIEGDSMEPDFKEGDIIVLIQS
jgi:phage repressor protein C with HTH and peptisase S24 domain